MIYREAGQFKASYQADRAIFPIEQDRWAVMVAILFFFLVVPFIGGDYLFQAILIPVSVTRHPPSL